MASETGFPASSQNIYYNGKVIQDNKQELQSAGIGDGDMIAIIISNPDTKRPDPSQSMVPPERDTQKIEFIRQQILSDAHQVASLQAKNPALAAAIHDPSRFQEAWVEYLAKLEKEKAERANEIRLLNEDPFNSDTQKRIEDMIRREKIQENLQYAYENNPAGRYSWRSFCNQV